MAAAAAAAARAALTCFLLDLAEDAEQGGFHPVAVQRVLPEREQEDKRLKAGF